MTHRNGSKSWEKRIQSEFLLQNFVFAENDVVNQKCVIQLQYVPFLLALSFSYLNVPWGKAKREEREREIKQKWKCNYARMHYRMMNYSVDKVYMQCGIVVRRWKKANDKKWQVGQKHRTKIGECATVIWIWMLCYSIHCMATMAPPTHPPIIDFIAYQRLLDSKIINFRNNHHFSYSHNIRIKYSECQIFQLTHSTDWNFPIFPPLISSINLYEQTYWFPINIIIFGSRKNYVP